MVIRRIREHVTAHNWFAVGIDVGIVVLGVFLGTQVNNWNEERGQRAQSHEDRQRLADDLAANEVDYSNRLVYFAAVRRHAEATLAALAKPPSANGEQFLIDAYQASQIVPREAKHVTYDEILATGRLTRLGAPALRDRVGNLYLMQQTNHVTLGNVPSYRERLRRAMPSAIQVAVRTRCPEQRTSLADGTILNRLPETCTLGLDPATIAAGVSAVRGIPELSDELNRLVGDLAIKIELARISRLQVRDLRQRIVAADKRS